MPKKPRVPSYRLHKPTGQAVVTLNGRDRYLGKHGSAKSQKEYGRLIAELTSAPSLTVTGTHDLTVAELVARYLRHARAYYRKHGTPTSEVVRVNTRQPASVCWT